MVAARTAEHIREVNARYHDFAAHSYDGKWGIDFGEQGRAQVLGKLTKALGELPREPFARALEIGSGTGYFSLNLLAAGVIDSATCTDVSAGMLSTLRANAARLGLDVDAKVSEASALPFEDASFDIVLGHAVLHHLPDLQAAFAELARVLAPGGTLAFAGEPSHYGDRIATVPKRGAALLAPVWRRLVGAQRRGNGGGPENAAAHHAHALEHEVDVHAFTPGQLVRLSREAGFEQVRVRGEEMVANWFGWANRALEATAVPEQIPMIWRRYAHRGYLLLQRVDEHLLEPRLPPGAFYNLILSARKPASTKGVPR
jgi:SAM-dependent methyltransferase